MTNRKHREILKKQLEIRAKLWPELNPKMLWAMDSDGWVAVPRLMPLIMSVMDDLSGKGFPVSRTYFEMWARLRHEQFLTLNRPEEMAFHAGFEGQRALRTWKDRVQRLANLGFIGVKPGPLGDLSYAVFFNPYHVVKRAYLDNKIQERKWQALVVRASEVGSFDLDELDDDGNLVDDAEEEVKPAKKTMEKGKLRKSRTTKEG
ncbi:MAG: hypothetical protein OXC63_12910 [Aestuariivita sp.]|nr:hypothetical protein [Aestuariivita sp.]MCY4347317.1 hypothetical protein [Aestuariivita sp.]